MVKQGILAVLAIQVLFNVSAQNNGHSFIDSDENYIVVPDDAAINFSNDFSLEMWVKPRTIEHDMLLFQEGKCSTADWSYELFIRADSAVVFGSSCSGVCSDVNLFATTAKVLPNVCTHIAATYSSAGVKIYFDGVEQSGTSSGTPYCGDLVTSNGPLRIGSYVNAGGTDVSFFDGFMDEARIWNFTLSPAEVAGNFASAPLAGDEDGLVLYYRLEGIGSGSSELVPNSAIITGSVLDGTTFSLSTGSPYSDSVQCVNFSETPTNEDVRKMEFRIFPNPASELVTLNGIEMEGDFTFQLLSADGKVLGKEIFSTFPFVFDVSTLTSGCYLVRIADSVYGDLTIKQLRIE